MGTGLVVLNVSSTWTSSASRRAAGRNLRSTPLAFRFLIHPVQCALAGDQVGIGHGTLKHEQRAAAQNPTFCAHAGAVARAAQRLG